LLIAFQANQAAPVVFIELQPIEFGAWRKSTFKAADADCAEVGWGHEGAGQQAAR
jgi:hypothetical protein